MTQRGGIDWDRLADHLGGALDGTPEGVHVARLIDTDPGWARAATELSTAYDAVAADLHLLPEPAALPDEVAARLDTALRAAGTGFPSTGSQVREADARSLDGLPATPVPDHRGGTVAPGPTLAPSRTPAPGPATGRDRRPPGHPRSRPGRRRAARWGAGFAAAAGVAASVAVGFAIWSPAGQQITADGNDQGDAGTESAIVDQPRNGAEDVAVVIASGTDYQQPSVGTAEPQIRPVPGTPELGTSGNRDPVAQPPENPTGEERVSDLVPPALAWMWVDPAARERCLELIRAALGPPPVTIQTVDFAQFQGEDALVIWATVADETRIVWVSGPDCGTPGAGPDELFQEPLG